MRFYFPRIAYCGEALFWRSVANSDYKIDAEKVKKWMQRAQDAQPWNSSRISWHWVCKYV